MTKLAARVKDALDAQWKRRDVSSVTLHLPYPPSTNRLWQKIRGGMSKTPRYATWTVAAGQELASQRPGRVRGYYMLSLSLSRPDKRRRDLDNAVKAISDLLVTHGVVDDDSMARRVMLEWLEDGVPGATVTVTSVAAALSPVVIASKPRRVA